MTMCFSNKVQVKFNLLQNLHLKICAKREAWSWQKGFQFLLKIYIKKFFWHLKHWVDLLKAKKCLYGICFWGLTFLSIIISE